MGLGYEYTTSSLAIQNHENYISNFAWSFGNRSDVCSRNRIVSRIVCSQFLPPCFLDDPHGVYTACGSHCDQIPANCTFTMPKQFGKGWAINLCRNLGTHEIGGGICKVSSWRHAHFWPSPTPEQKKDRNIPPEVIVAIVMAVVITAVLTLAVVLVWRGYHPNAGFHYHRYGQRPEEDTADLEL